MNKKIVLLFLIVLSIFVMSNVSAADIDAQMMENTNEDIADVSISDESLNGNQNDVVLNEIRHVNSGQSIQEAIDSANDGDTIILNGTFELESEVKINKTLNITGEGDGASIKYYAFALSKKRLFNIDSSTSNVVLNNLKFIEANYNGFGGAVLFEGDNGIINNCVFDRNIAGGSYSGAVLVTGQNCNITNCVFKANRADQYGGAVVIDGDNSNVINCTFNDNRADQYGGAVVLGGLHSSVIGCTFENNYAVGSKGGAIVVRGSENRIYNCRFDKNYVSNSLNSTSDVGGGAIYCDCENLEINGCNFTDNYANNSNGGAISLGRNNIVNGSFFKGNTAILGNDIYSGSRSNVMSNYFILDYGETQGQAIYGSQLIISQDNTFNRTKINSSVTFSAGMIFEYAASGSIYVTVKGGTIQQKNIAVLNHPEAKITFANNVLTVSNLAVGIYTLRVTTTPDENHTAVDSDLRITVKKATAVIKASKLTVALKSAAAWTIKIVDPRNNNPIANMKVTLKVYTGKKYKTLTLYTNSKGEVSYKTKSLAKGTHKIVVSASHKGYTLNSLKSSITVVKQTVLKYKLQSRVNDKGGSLLSYIVLNKKTKKGVNGVKIKCLIYTGKKYKTYVLKTKKIKGKKETYNGAVGFATNSFSAGKHKVKLMPYSIKYKGSVTSCIKLKKSAVKGPKYFRKV
ncbi:hypothetical protein [Methanobrevibacter sp.]|uniref:hypothetical protein n=1 Tax=Methanobrevibacter sp. TaxID=66852 RepID=UPI0025DF6EDE|nr:hypothetical protein [Methanobrevibacter sp.]MBR4448559.1 hypothetical protein [Methanobrevibacter sp.]